MSVNILKDGKFVQIAGSVSNDLISGVIEEAVKQAVDAASKYTDEIAAKVGAFSTKRVTDLPIDDISKSTIYFTLKENPVEGNLYDEWMFINNNWEQINEKSLDISKYYTKEEIVQLIQKSAYKLPVASSDTLGGVKVDDETIKISNDGLISIAEEFLNNKIDSKLQILTSDEHTEGSIKQIIKDYGSNAIYKENVTINETIDNLWEKYNDIKSIESDEITELFRN